ncbi:MAG TPA: hypothetical protein VMP01_02910 [Pirellulaceae bacterium]|nr:hypothetical protein [Pirellulaceae bacterium]
MLPDLSNAVPKIHPATRGIEPEDPLNLHAVEVDGDPQIMLQMLVEDYARMGFGLEELMNLCRQPFYVGLHGLWLRYGEEALRQRLSGILSRCGVFRTVVREAPPVAALSGVPRDLLQIEAATSLERDHHA